MKWWTRPSAPGCGESSKAWKSYCSILGGDQGNLAPGSLSSGAPAGRAPLLLKRRDGSMYCQAHVRGGAVSRFERSRPWSWVLKRYLWEADGPVSAGVQEKLLYSKNLVANISSWSYDVEGHAKNCVERCCELPNKTTQQLCKVSTPCLDDHQVEEEETESVGELSKVCSQIVLKCLFLARIGRPDRHSMVSKQTCSFSHQMDQSFWQTLGSFDFFCTTPVNLSNVVKSETLHTMQTGTVSGLWFCRRFRRLKIDFGEKPVYLWQSHGCSHKLDVSFSQFDWTWKLFLLMQVYAWLKFWLLIFGIWLLKCCILLPT